MNQASRIIAAWTRPAGGTGTSESAGEPELISRDRVACAAWKRAVGKKLASHTNAHKLVRERLIVEVEDETWRVNLWGLRFHILRNLNAALGPDIVKELEFRVMPPRRQPQRATQATTIEGAPLPLFDEADGIEDQGLRRIYKNSRALAQRGENVKRQSA